MTLHLRGLIRAIGVSFLVSFPFLIVLFVSGCQASSGPSQDLLKNRLAIQLPPYLSIRSFKVEVSENVGTKVEPIFKSRIKAEVEALEDTFTPGVREENVLYIIPMCKKGDRKMLYGVATSVPKASSWDVQYRMEENAGAYFGTPRTSFGGQTVIKGSPEEDRIRLARLEREKRRAEQRLAINIPKEGQSSEFDFTVYPDEWSVVVDMPYGYSWNLTIVGQDGLRILVMPDKDDSRTVLFTKGKSRYSIFDRPINTLQFKSAETGPVIVKFRLTPKPVPKAEP